MCRPNRLRLLLIWVGATWSGKKCTYATVHWQHVYEQVRIMTMDSQAVLVLLSQMAWQEVPNFRQTPPKLAAM